MGSRTVLIALLFGALAAGLAAIGFSAQEKYLAYRAEHPQVRTGVFRFCLPMRSHPTPLSSNSRTSPIDPEPAASAHPRFSLPQLPKISAENSRGLAIGGLAGLFFGSYLWLLVSALQVGGGWGVAVFFGNYVAGLIFLFCHPSKAAGPMLLHTLSWVLLMKYWYQLW